MLTYLTACLFLDECVLFSKPKLNTQYTDVRPEIQHIQHWTQRRLVSHISKHIMVAEQACAHPLGFETCGLLRRWRRWILPEASLKVKTIQVDHPIIFP